MTSEHSSSRIPGWYPDPSTRHENRYWDGGRWTAWVGNGGVTTGDPLEPHRATPPDDSAAGPHLAGDGWFFSHLGQRVGPLDDGEVATAIAEGRIRFDSLVWRSGMQEWKPAANSELAAPIRTIAAAPPPTSRAEDNTAPAQAASTVGSGNRNSKRKLIIAIGIVAAILAALAIALASGNQASAVRCGDYEQMSDDEQSSTIEKLQREKGVSDNDTAVGVDIFNRLCPQNSPDAPLGDVYDDFQIPE